MSTYHFRITTNIDTIWFLLCVRYCREYDTYVWYDVCGVIPHSNKTTEYRKTVGCHAQNRVNPWNLIRNWGITNSQALWKYVKTEYPLSFLAATKQLYEWSFPSVCLSVCHTFLAAFLLCSHHRIIMKFSGVITNDRSDVHAKGQGQRSRSQRSTPNLTVSGL